MPVWILCQQSLILSGLEQFIIGGDKCERRKLCPGQQVVQGKSSRQLYGVVTAQLLTFGEVHNQVYKCLVNFYKQIFVRKIVDQILKRACVVCPRQATASVFTGKGSRCFSFGDFCRSCRTAGRQVTHSNDPRTAGLGDIALDQCTGVEIENRAGWRTCHNEPRCSTTISLTGLPVMGTGEWRM